MQVQILPVQEASCQLCCRRWKLSWDGLQLRKLEEREVKATGEFEKFITDVEGLLLASGDGKIDMVAPARRFCQGLHAAGLGIDINMRSMSLAVQDSSTNKTYECTHELHDDIHRSNSNTLGLFFSASGERRACMGCDYDGARAGTVGLKAIWDDEVSDKDLARHLKDIPAFRKVVEAAYFPPGFDGRFDQCFIEPGVNFDVVYDETPLVQKAIAKAEKCISIARIPREHVSGRLTWDDTLSLPNEEYDALFAYKAAERRYIKSLRAIGVEYTLSGPASGVEIVIGVNDVKRTENIEPRRSGHVVNDKHVLADKAKEKHGKSKKAKKAKKAKKGGSYPVQEPATGLDSCG